MNTKEINNVEIHEIVKRIVAQYEGNLPSSDKENNLIQENGHEIRVESSASHIHLSEEALESLFGKGSSLRVENSLSQPGEFLSQYRAKLVTAKGSLERVAILGPLRQRTQVELSQTDAIKLGLNAPINISGDFSGAEDILIVGTEGIFDAKQSVIVARAHIHYRRSDAQIAGLSDGDIVSVRVTGKRGAVLENVVVRVNDNFSPVLHIDHDEANACGLIDSSRAFIQVDANRLQTNQLSVISATTCADKPYMYEKVITEDIAKKLVANGNINSLRKGTIITPSAKDVFLHAGVELRFISQA